MEQTFIILKPDAIKRGLVGKIISRFEDKGFEILRIQLKYKDKDWCRLHYTNLDNNIFNRVCLFMVNTPLIGILLEGPDAVRIIRRMVGSTDSLEAEPGTIRGDYGGAPIHENLVHASTSEYEVLREANLFWDEHK